MFSALDCAFEATSGSESKLNLSGGIGHMSISEEANWNDILVDWVDSRGRTTDSRKVETKRRNLRNQEMRKIICESSDMSQQKLVEGNFG